MCIHSCIAMNADLSHILKANELQSHSNEKNVHRDERNSMKRSKRCEFRLKNPTKSEHKEKRIRFMDFYVD